MQDSKTLQDLYKQFELDMLYAGKSSGNSEGIIKTMQAQQRLASMPQGGSVESLTPISPLDFLAETAMTGASQMENMNPLAVLLAGALAPGAYKKLKTTNTPALLKKFDIKVDNPLYHNTGVWSAGNILKTGRVKPANVDKSVSLTRNPEYSSVPGKSGGDLDVQIVLDKKGIKSQEKTKIEPFVSIGGGWKSKYGSPTFGKSSPWFEAEERVFTAKGISSENIKAIKIRDAEADISSLKYNGESLESLLKRAANKKIPVIVEPAAEEGVIGLLDLMNPKQQSKILKNTKFGGETVTLYRGVKKWHRGKMAKEGKFVGPDSPFWVGSVNRYKPSPGALFTTKDIDIGTGYRKSVPGLKHFAESRLLEFEVPKAYIEKFGLNPYSYKDLLVFDKGLPTAFIKKVHK